MNKKDFRFLLRTFLAWRILLFIFLFLAISVVPLQMDFLGGGLSNYLQRPYFWAWANFDGEHYLAIAQNGYGTGEQAFFPMYAVLMRILGSFLGGSLSDLNWAGLIISNLSFFIGLAGLTRLIRLDYKKEIAQIAIILLLLFPTSFYFGSVYTESLFLALAVWSFYYARKNRWLKAGILGGLATATRAVGIVLIPALLVELWAMKRGRLFRGSVAPLLAIALIPVGLVAYMIWLNQTTGDPLAFIHTLPGFGEQRSATPILLPQVFYRYIFKILPILAYSYFPVVFTTYLEFFTAIVFGALGGLGVLMGPAFAKATAGRLGKLGNFKFRGSYAVYLALGYLIPTLSGSFSSLSRYVLILFPAFILVAIWLSKKSRRLLTGLLVVLLLLFGVATALYIRGFWVA